MARRKNSLNGIEQVDYYEEVSDGSSESDVITGKVLSAFSFAPGLALSGAPALTKAFEFNSGKASAESLIDSREIKTEANAATPAVGGEAHSIGRYYKLRYSTAKMLNEIKAGH